MNTKDLVDRLWSSQPRRVVIRDIHGQDHDVTGVFLEAQEDVIVLQAGTVAEAAFAMVGKGKLG